MADEEAISIGGKPISSLRVVDLKKECDKRGLSKSGSKSQLVDRLKTQLMLENLGKDTDGPQLQEEDCQNEFIKQYLAQQKQLIDEHTESSVNSSSQESDADESPKKQRRTRDSPPLRSPPLEISPEKLDVLSEKPAKPVQKEKDKSELVQEEKPVPSSNSAEEKEEAEGEPAAESGPVRADRLVPFSKSAEEQVAPSNGNQPVGRQSEGAVTEEMERSKRRISRHDSGSKSQSDVTEPRRGRRSRNCSSAGSEQDGKDTEKDLPMEADSKDVENDTAEPEEGSEKLEQGNIGENKENGEKKMETAEKGDSEKIQKEEEQDKEKNPGKASPAKRMKSSSRSRSRSGTPPTKKKQPLQAQSSIKRRGRSSSSSSSSSSSRSRSRDRKKKGRSSSSSSSSSRSRSRSPEKTKKAKGVLRKKKISCEESRSSSSSRSRSRSPSPKRSKEQEERPATKAATEKVDSSTDQKDVEMLPAEMRQQRSPSRSSSSRSRSRSPEQSDSAKKAINNVSTSSDRKEVTPQHETVGADTEKMENKTREAKPSKKISLNRKTIEDAGKVKEEGQGDGEKLEGGDRTAEEKPTKKRRWGSRSTSTTQKPKKASSLPISTESLKSLIPDIKPSLKLAPEPVLEDEMDYEDDTGTTESVVAEQEDKRSVKIQRTVTQDVSKDKESEDDSSSESEDEKDDEEKQDSSSEEDGEDDEDKREVKAETKVEKEGPKVKVEKSVEKEEPAVKKTITVTTKVKKEKKDKNKEIKLVRRLDSGGSALIQPDEPLKPRRSPSPARNPVSKIIHIRNLVRPFTLNQLKELLRRYGSLIEDQFWIDRIKSHCFAVYDTDEQAENARKSLHNTTWPHSNPKTLIVDYGTEEQMDYYRGDEKPIPPPPAKKEKESAREQKQKEREERQKQIAEEREKEAQRRQQEREKRMKEREEREKERAKPVREWDRDKKTREDWDRTLQKSRSRSPRERRGQRSMSKSPSRDRSRESRERMARREKKKEKKEDEPPAKLLDDLFKKTKTTPCIYWLPLTEAQITEREKMGIVRPVLRQKQEGDRVSPMREIPDDDRSASRMGRTTSPPSSRRISQERERSRVGRASPERRRRDNSPVARDRVGGRRR